MKSWLALAGKLLLSLGLLWLAVRGVQPGSIRAAFRSADAVQGIASILVYVAALALFEPLRLATGTGLLREPRLSMVSWIALFTESRAFFLVLPAGVGQEGYLWWRLRQQGWTHISCGYLLLSIRMVGLAFWSMGLAWALQSEPFRRACSTLLVGPLAHGTIWLLLGLALLGLPLALPALMARFGRFRWSRGSALPWCGFLAATGAATACYVLAFLLAARALGLTFTVGQAVGCLTLIFLGLALPISMAGLGLQEGLLLLVGTRLGLQPGPLLGLSCLLHLQRWVPSLLGLGVFLRRRLRNPRPS